MEDINITLIQSDLKWENIEKNLINFDKKISSINEDTDLIILPEMFNTAFTMNHEKCAEDKNGRTIEWLKKHAFEKQCVITGSIIIRENDTYYNRLIWMNKDGTYFKYDKRHLFRLGKEDQHYTSGNEILITELKGWKFRPLICYDLRFPVWSKNKLNVSHLENVKHFEYEYDCLIYIANWPIPRINAWKSLLVARAIENQAYVIGVNRVGKDGNGIDHSGVSMAVDYSGKIINEIEANIEDIRTITLSYDYLNKYRQHFSFGVDWDSFTINN